MDKNSYYKYMFIVAALYNWIMAVVFILLSILSPSSVEDFGVDIPPTWFFAHAFYLFVCLFGLLFYVTGRSLEKYHGLAPIFVLEKVGAFITGLLYFLMGETNAAAFVIGAIGDLIFGILFFEYWLKFE